MNNKEAHTGQKVLHWAPFLWAPVLSNMVNIPKSAFGVGSTCYLCMEFLDAFWHCRRM